MGRAEGIEIEEIVLHPFGGLARLRNEPESPRAEFRIAVAGPAASFLFAAVSFVLMLPAMMAGYPTAGGVLLLLCAGNLLLASFPDIHWMAGACCARSCGGAPATSRKRRVSPVFAGC
jgi:Zn-dependent protease